MNFLRSRKGKMGLLVVLVLGVIYAVSKGLLKLPAGLGGSLIGGIDPAKKALCLSWANSDGNPTSRSIRVAGINQLNADGINKLHTVITQYWNTSTQPPSDLQAFLDANPMLSGSSV